MARVNPPDQKVPEDIAKDYPKFFRWMQEEQFQKFQMWKRTGGGDDLIDGISSSESYDTSSSTGETNSKFDSLEQIEDEIPPTIARIFTTVTTSQNYTAIDLDFVQASKNTITFDPNADIDDEIIISIMEAPVKIVGNVYIRKLETELNARRVGNSYHFKKLADYWRIV